MGSSEREKIQAERGVEGEGREYQVVHMGESRERFYQISEGARKMKTVEDAKGNNEWCVHISSDGKYITLDYMRGEWMPIPFYIHFCPICATPRPPKSDLQDRLFKAFMEHAKKHCSGDISAIEKRHWDLAKIAETVMNDILKD